MDVFEALSTAANIMLLGMVCVFAFLGLLVIVINTIAKYCPEEAKAAPAKQNNVNGQVSPDVVAAISAAVHKYRKSRD